MKLKKLICIVLALACLLGSCAALGEEAPVLRGYDKQTRKYQYALFGTYPYEKDGSEAPVLWRVLGPGVPSDEDIISKSNEPKWDWKKRANRDELTEENDDVFLMITQYIIDTVLYHPERDVQDGPGLDYADTNVRHVLCDEVLPRIFTPEQQAVLVEMPQRGLLGLPSRRGELFHPDYGFVEEDFGEMKRRVATGTPYAFDQGLRNIQGNSWSWTPDWRAPGRRWIVGDNGHISVSGLDREGGIRPICYVKSDMIQITGGTGTIDDPFIFALK